MVKSLTLFIFFLLLSFRLILADTIEEKWPNGKVSKKYSTDLQNKKTGAYSEFFENGQIKIKTTYKNDLLDGFYYEFLEDGNKRVATQYSKGLKNGFHRTYDKGNLLKEEIWVEGCLAFPKSIAEINQTFLNIKKLNVEFVGEWPKEFNADRFTKSIENDNIAGLTKLREYRYLCDLPYEDLQIHKTYIAHDLNAVLILNKLKGLSHTPKNPGVPEDIYTSGYQGTTQSNLTWSNYGMCASLSVDIYMDDSEAINLERLGHRRWCLNPSMKLTGFGLEENFSAMWSCNNSREQIPDFDFISFPCKGFMPNSHFKAIDAWSVSVNSKYYQIPDKTLVKIQIYSVKEVAKTELKISYQNIDFTPIGIDNCIIFKPENISISPKSRYFVSISGLKDKNLKDTKIEYFVEFFETKASSQNKSVNKSQQ